MTTHAHAVPPATARICTPADTGHFEVTAAPENATRATVRLRGEMDMATAELLTAVLASQLGSGRRFVRLDLSELTFMDCSGLRAFVQAHNDFLAARGTLVLAGARPHIARLLRISHLDEALFIADGSGESHRRGRSHLSAIADQ